MSLSFEKQVHDDDSADTEGLCIDVYLRWQFNKINVYYLNFVVM